MGFRAHRFFYCLACHKIASGIARAIQKILATQDFRFIFADNKNANYPSLKWKYQHNSVTI